MAAEDRHKWNERYRRGDHASGEVVPELPPLMSWLPTEGRALDVAGGAGRHAVWLANRGFDVLLADISEVALALATDHARRANVTIETVCVDLEQEPLPAGPWQLILFIHYLNRSLIRRAAQQLAPGGTLAMIHPTESNQQRHARPPRRFLLGDGELPSLMGALQVVHYTEGWSADGRHNAVLVARHP